MFGQRHTDLVSSLSSSATRTLDTASPTSSSRTSAETVITITRRSHRIWDVDFNTFFLAYPYEDTCQTVKREDRKCKSWCPSQTTERHIHFKISVAILFTLTSFCFAPAYGRIRHFSLFFPIFQSTMLRIHMFQNICIRPCSILVHHLIIDICALDHYFSGHHFISCLFLQDVSPKDYTFNQTAYQRQKFV